MANNSLIRLMPLGFHWPVSDPFLFCAHHKDDYPRGNGQLGPAAPLAGRDLGQDFTVRDGWRMYHGEVVPGFPEHPHRGFETVTIVKTGMVDHSDSYGQAGRYGAGDVQWMTAGAGLQHSEMFPLLRDDDDNPLELFQVWLNLPAARKMAKPFYKMLWAEDIPVYRHINADGKYVVASVIAGKLYEVEALPPAPDSWATDPQNEVAIWTVKMDAGTSWKLPPAGNRAGRTLYFYRGGHLHIDGVRIEPYHAAVLNPELGSEILSGESDSFFLLLQGRPIAEPMAQYGPFVMNNQQEIQQAIHDYRTTSFGGWPWPRRDMVHPPSKGRFAKYTDQPEELR